VFVVAVEPEFDFLSAEYRDLFARSRATAFQHPVWLDTLYRRLAPAVQADPLIVVVRYAGEGGVALVLPLVRRRYGTLRTIEFADLGVSDYACPIVAGTAADAMIADRKTCASIVAALQPFDVLRIQKLRAGTFPIERLLGTAARSAMPMSSHAVELSSPYAEWRTAKIGPASRKSFDKKSRQLHRKGHVTLACVTEPAAIRSTLEHMRALRASRFPDSDLLQLPGYYDFYLAAALQGCGSFMRVYGLTLDGDLISGALALSDRGRTLVIATAFDIANHRNQSVGLLTFDMIAQHCIAMGDKVLDFTIGDEPYKSVFGAKPAPIHQVSRHGSVFGAVANAAVQQAPWLKQVARRIFDVRPSPSVTHMLATAASAVAPAI
jgi:CelD/BcsL family acetyltransferase involved in cellulose biosynthesis